MRRVIDLLVLSLFAGSAIALMFAAPTGDFTQTVAYVLLVECPVVILLVMGISAYIEWSSRR